MNDYKFGNFICQLRTEKGLSQSQLGNMLGVSNKAVSKWEMGISKPRPDMLVTLATLFDVTIEELLAGEKKAEIENEERKESKDNTIKLWANEYLKKKKSGLVAVLMAVLLPIVLFVGVGVIVGLDIDAKILGPIFAMVILFAEAIDIALIFVFYGSARRLKRILYSTYHEHEEEISAIISYKKEKTFTLKWEDMLRWEKICYIIGASIMLLCPVLRIIVHGRIETDILFIINIVVAILLVSAGILLIIVVIHYTIRMHKIKNKNK